MSSGGYTAFTYSPTGPGRGGGFGRLRTNQPGYAQNFNGIELTPDQAALQQWMARVAFSWNDWVEHFGRGTHR